MGDRAAEGAVIRWRGGGFDPPRDRRASRGCWIALSVMRPHGRRLACGIAALVLAGCVRAPGSAPPFAVVLDASTGQGVAPRGVVSVGAVGATVEGAIGAVVLTPTGAPLPQAYTLTLVVGAAVGGRLEGLRVEAGTWRVETASGLGEAVTDAGPEGDMRTTARPGMHVRIAAGAPGQVRVTLGAEAVRRIARAGGGRVAWVDAYRR